MGVCDVPGVSHVCDTATTAAGQAAGAAVSTTVGFFAQALGDTASWVVQGMWSVLTATTRIDLGSKTYQGVYGVVLAIGVCLMLLLFFAQLAGGLLRRDPTALATATVGLGKAVVGSFLVVTVTGTALEVTDQLAVGIVHASGTTLEAMGGRIAAALGSVAVASVPAPGVGLIVGIVLSGLAIVGAGVLWASLMIRKAVLLVAIVMAPIALSGWVWSATKEWVRRWVAVVAALIVSKLVVVVVLLVATAQLSSPVEADLASVSEPVAGVVLLFLAAFAPYMAYRFIGFAGIDAATATGAEQDTRTAIRPGVRLHTPLTAASLLRQRTPATTRAATVGRGAGAGAAGGPGVRAAGAAGAVVGVARTAATTAPRTGRAAGQAASAQHAAAAGTTTAPAPSLSTASAGASPSGGRASAPSPSGPSRTGGSAGGGPMPHPAAGVLHPADRPDADGGG